MLPSLLREAQVGGEKKNLVSEIFCPLLFIVFSTCVLFGIGVPGCAGLSFMISPPFPYPSAPLPVSSPVLPSFYNNCHSFQSGKEAARRGGWAGTRRVTGPQQLVQPMEFREIDSLDVFFLSFTPPPLL